MIRLVAALVLAAGAAAAQDPTVTFEDDNPQMAAAISDARRTLPVFFGALETAQNPALKVAVPVDEARGGGREHIWMNGCGPSATEDLACAVANAPAFVDLEPGQTYDFTLDDVSDWMYFDSEGRIHGAFTLRVLLPHIDPAEAERYRAMLAPPPS